jgi:hypothetical protein
MEMTHLGSATVHHLKAHLLLVGSEKNLVQNIARDIDRLSLEPHRPAISHKVLFFLSTTPFLKGAYMDSKSGVQDPSHGKRFQSESF